MMIVPLKAKKGIVFVPQKRKALCPSKKGMLFVPQKRECSSSLKMGILFVSLKGVVFVHQKGSGVNLYLKNRNVVCPSKRE